MIRAKGKRKTRTCKGRQVAGLNRVIRIGLHKARDSNCTYWCNIQWLMQMKSQRLFTITPLSKQDQDPKLWGSHTSPLPFASMAQLQLFWLGIHALLFQFGLLNLQGEKKHISIKPWCKKSLMLPPFLLPSTKFCHILLALQPFIAHQVAFGISKGLHQVPFSVSLLLKTLLGDYLAIWQTNPRWRGSG